MSLNAVELPDQAARLMDTHSYHTSNLVEGVRMMFSLSIIALEMVPRHSSYDQIEGASPCLETLPIGSLHCHRVESDEQDKSQCPHVAVNIIFLSA